MTQRSLPSPFFTTSVAIADEFIKCFRQPLALLSCLEKLSDRLGITVMQEKTIKVKGSWKTISDLEQFLRKLDTYIDDINQVGGQDAHIINLAFTCFETDLEKEKENVIKPGEGITESLNCPEQILADLSTSQNDCKNKNTTEINPAFVEQSKDLRLLISSSDRCLKQSENCKSSRRQPLSKSRKSKHGSQKQNLKESFVSKGFEKQTDLHRQLAETISEPSGNTAYENTRSENTTLNNQGFEYYIDHSLNKDELMLTLQLKSKRKQNSVLLDKESPTNIAPIVRKSSRLKLKPAKTAKHRAIAKIKVKRKIVENNSVTDNATSTSKQETTEANIGKSGEYHCDLCLFQTSTSDQLKCHKLRRHGSKRHRCIQCQKDFAMMKDLKRHMKGHANPGNFCTICGKFYKEIRHLNHHMKSHENNFVKPNFTCTQCEKSFSTKYVLAQHVKSKHAGIKRHFICPTCGKSFTQKHSYREHARVHLGIKGYTCETCGRQFSYETALREHKFTHLNEKVFKCEICGKSFQQKNGLICHLKSHQPLKDHVCSVCGKEFTQRQALYRHERIHTQSKPYECGLCHRKFTDSSTLRRHMISVHKKHPNQWREDTIDSTQRNKHFFINTLNVKEVCNDNPESSYETPNLEQPSEIHVYTTHSADNVFEQEKLKNLQEDLQYLQRHEQVFSKGQTAENTSSHFSSTPHFLSPEPHGEQVVFENLENSLA